MTDIAERIEQYTTQPVYIVNTSGIHLGGTASLKANDLILSTVAASKDDWKNLQNIDSAKAQGAISMEKGAGIEVHGALKTQSTTLHVADGVWFTIDPDTNTTSGWSEGSVDSTDAWSQGTVAFEATQQLQFSGTLQQVDGRANAKPVAVSLTGQSLELKKESDNGGKISVWGQELTDLPDGVYAAEVTTQGKGDAKSFDLYFIGDNGEKKTAAIQDSGWKNWRTVRIDGITIKGGKATVGIEQQGNGDNWGSIDNVKFYRKS